MPIQITTQYMENYGDEDAPFWKFKGGSTYFFHGDPQRDQSYMALVGQLRSLIEYDSSGSEEFVTSIDLRDEPEVEEWETITEITKIGDEFHASVTEFGVDYDDEGGCLQGKPTSRKTWVMLPRGGRESYQYEVLS